MGAPNIADAASGVPQQFYDAEIPQFALVVAALSGTASLTNGLTSVTFSAAQSLTAGTQLQFASQPGIWYTVAATTTTSTSATLTAAFTGNTVAATSVNAAAALAGTCSVTQGSRSITFSQNQTLAQGTLLAFSSQPGVYYGLSAVITASTAGTLVSAYQGVTAAAATVLASPSLTGTVTVTNATAAITFSVAQTLAEGTALVFSSQPGVVYSLSAAISAATAGVLTTNYTGTTSSTATTVAGTTDWVPQKANGVARGLLCLNPGTAVIDCYGLSGPGSGSTLVPVPMLAGQQSQIALVRIHRTSSGQFLLLY